MTEYDELLEKVKEISGAFFPAQREADEITLTSRWYFGKVVMESSLYKRDKVHIVAKLAKARKCSKVTIYRELRFFEMFPNIEQVPGVLDFEPVKETIKQIGGGNLTWYVVANKVLCKQQEETKCRIPISRRGTLVDTVDRIKETEAKLVTLHEGSGKRIETIEII